MLKYVILTVCSFQFIVVSAKISCKDDDGNDVDWFIISKYPKIPKYSANGLVNEGLAYYYFDPSVQNGRLSTVGINSTNNALAKTLNQILNNHDSEKVAYLMYNDSPPNDTRVPSRKGHTKGVVCLDEACGFWLIHSVRLFPKSSEGEYSWPNNANSLGQSLICVSAKVPDGSFKQIMTALQYNCPNIYNSHVPQVIKEAVEGLESVADGHCEDSKERCKYHAEIETQGGVTIDIFAKSAKFNADIYSDFIAPHFESNMYAETWQKGSAENLKSFCKGYKVENVRSLTLPGDVNFKSTKDHSKWAVTTT
ncbi:plancitoxin-1-like [Ptychodera flava]|uniref:plancitoxin-1-like n=1 Tax=Ptychodera flava TaxID=63121 RepID=UPI00396A26EC